MEEIGVIKYAPRPTPRKKRHKPTKRMRDRAKNRAHYAAKTKAARVEFLGLASSAVDKLGAALDAWGRDDQWFVPIADPGQVSEGAGAALPRPKEVALVKRAQVVHRYLQLQVASGNTNCRQNQRAVAEHHNVSAPLVASWTRDFLHLEPRPDPPAAAGGGEATSPVDYRPLTFPPINPYTVSPEVMPILTDKRIRSICTWYVRANANVKGRPNMKASDFQRWVNTFLIPNHLSQLRPYRAKVILTYNNELVTPDGAAAPPPGAWTPALAETLDEAVAESDKTWAISLTTAKRWLFHLDFRKTKHKKTMYIDGHERADVVKDRLRYIAELDQYLSRMDQYGGADMNDVTPRTSEEAEVVLVVHDEVVVHQNDGEDWSYQQVNVSHVLAVFVSNE